MVAGKRTNGPPPPRRPSLPFWNCGDETVVVSGSAAAPSAGPPPAAASSRPLPPQQRVRSFVDGIISPFMSCVQPPLQACMAPSTEWEPPQQQLPDANLARPHRNDVLCGRGGSSNRHPGNMNFRELIAANRQNYGPLTKKQKMLMARQIVDLIHNTQPPGRFLARDAVSGQWYDIGLPRSLEKTSQAFREKTAEQRAAAKAAAAAAAARNAEAMDTRDGSEPISSQLSHDSTEGVEQSLGSGSSNNNGSSSSKTSKNRRVEPPIIVIPYHLQSVFLTQSSRQQQQQQQPMVPMNGYMQPAPLDPRYPPQPYPGQQQPHHRGAPAMPASYRPSAAAPEERRDRRGPPVPGQQQLQHHSIELMMHAAGQPPRIHHVSPVITTSMHPAEQQQHQQQQHFAPPPPPPTATPQYHSSGRSLVTPSYSFEPPSSPGMRSNASSSVDGAPSLVHSVASNSSAGLSSIHNNDMTMGAGRNNDHSPGRAQRQETKRQRTSSDRRSSLSTVGSGSSAGTGTTTATGSLSHAIESQLSLEERVVRRDLASPSALLQGRSRRSFNGRRSNNNGAADGSQSSNEMDGMAALATAAFLRLDEND